MESNLNINKTDSGFLVFVRLVEACNLKCSHCLIPANPQKMSVEQCKTIPDLLEEHIPLGSEVTIKWHGGEPTLFGAKRLAGVMDYLKNDSRFNFRFEIRTNLLNISGEWINVFKNYFKSGVGVSWDYGIRKLPTTDLSSEYDRLFFHNLEMIVKNGIQPRLAITVTKPFIDWYENHVMDVIGWVRKYNLADIVFLRLIKTGRALTNWDEIGVSNKEFSEFIIKTFDLMSVIKEADGFDGVFPICEYRDILSGAARDTNYQSCFNGWCDSNSMSIDEKGLRRGCLTMDTQSIEHTEDLYKITVRDITFARQDRTKSCGACIHNMYCNTGCFSALKMDASGECSGGSMIFNFMKNKMGV